MKQTIDIEPTTQAERLVDALRTLDKTRVRLRKTEADLTRLRTELEIERMRLAACSTAALGYNDPPLERESPYWSASLGDVMRLRAELAEWQSMFPPETICPEQGGLVRWTAEDLRDAGKRLVLRLTDRVRVLEAELSEARALVERRESQLLSAVIGDLWIEDNSVCHEGFATGRTTVEIKEDIGDRTDSSLIAAIDEATKGVG